MMTSGEANKKLAAVEQELSSASDAFDAALAADEGADAAEERVRTLSRERDRLVRQIGILREAEAAAARTHAKHTDAQALENLAECQQWATDAVDAFAPVFRERIAELVALAQEELGPTLEALRDAQLTVHRLRATTPPQLSQALLMGVVLKPDMLGVQASMYMMPDARQANNQLLEALLFIEQFVRAPAPENDPHPLRAA